MPRSTRSPATVSAAIAVASPNRARWIALAPLERAHERCDGEGHERDADDDDQTESRLLHEQDHRDGDERDDRPDQAAQTSSADPMRSTSLARDRDDLTGGDLAWQVAAEVRRAPRHQLLDPRPRP